MGLVTKILRSVPIGGKRWLRQLPGADRLASSMYQRMGEQLAPIPGRDFSLYLDMRSPTHRAYATTRFAESYLADHLERSLSPGAVVIDVGAFAGFFTILCATRVGPEGNVYAFDPMQENCQRIERSAQANGLQ